ncbi:secretin N-terminal domain-containing protein [Piscinibacter sp.]|uniref:secretin N-terminal domain-containing protein n=1 Tax=Piscinibacter sp. TaxID=1903157 RepID=UPI0035B12D05
MTTAPRHAPWRLAAIAAALWLAGCAAQQHNGDGMKLLRDGRTVEGLASLKKASELDPNNPRYRIDYLAHRELASQAALNRADEARLAGRLDEAAKGYQEVLRFNEASERAQRGLQLVQEQRKADTALALAEKHARAGQHEAAQDVLRRAAKDLPGNSSVQSQLRTLEDKLESERAARERALAAQSSFRRPVTLQFRDANLKMVFEALSRTANVNIILDRDVKSDLKTTIYVKDASVEDTIDLILLQNQLEKRVLNNNTLFVYPATSAKQKEYNELKVRSFQISNVDAAHVANIIKSLLKTKDIVTDARTNTLVMRDTADAIAVAEKLVAANDVPDPEVMLEVQVLEVSADRMSNLGVKWPDAFGVSTPSGANTIGELRSLTRNDLVTTPLSVALNLMLQDTETNILASPRIRTRNKEKARILVGDKVPVITNLLTPQQAGATSVITGSIQYVDVGIKLEVEPQVYVDNDVGIKINLEVSNIAKTVETASGIAYQIGTRSAQTSLRLKDGETQVLAGLINDQDRSTASKVPGLGQVPVAGRLFSSTKGDATKSEIVLSITPRIVRAQTMPEARTGDVWSGTESVVREKPLRLDPIGAAKSGSAAEMPALAPSGGAGTAAGPQPAAGPKAGGAGGSTILGGSRAALDLPAAAPAAAAGQGGGAATGTGALVSAGTASGTPGIPGGGSSGAIVGGVSETPAPVTNQRRPAPASIQPGRALTPAAPSAPAGTAAPAAPPVAPDEV